MSLRQRSTARKGTPPNAWETLTAHRYPPLWTAAEVQIWADHELKDFSGKKDPVTGKPGIDFSHAAAKLLKAKVNGKTLLNIHRPDLKRMGIHHKDEILILIAKVKQEMDDNLHDACYQGDSAASACDIQKMHPELTIDETNAIFDKIKSENGKETVTVDCVHEYLEKHPELFETEKHEGVEYHHDDEGHLNSTIHEYRDRSTCKVTGKARHKKHRSRSSNGPGSETIEAQDSLKKKKSKTVKSKLSALSFGDDDVGEGLFGESGATDKAFEAADEKKDEPVAAFSVGDNVKYIGKSKRHNGATGVVKTLMTRAKCAEVTLDGKDEDKMWKFSELEKVGLDAD